MAKEAEELVFDLPAEDVIVGGGDPAVVDVPKVAPVVEKEDEPDGDDGALEVGDALDAIKRDLEESKRVSDAKAREADEARQALAAERVAKVKTEERLVDVQDQALRDRWHLVNSELQQINNGLASINQEIASAKRDYKLAFEAGDADAVTNAQERLALAAADLRTLEGGKAGAEQEVRKTEAVIRNARQAQAERRAAPPAAPAAEAPKTKTPDDWIADVRTHYGSKPADWIASHREFVTDPKLNQKLLKFAEYYATVEEKPLDSKDFVSALNAKFFPQERDMEDEAPKAKAPAAPSKRAVASAPVSNGASFFSSNNMDAKKVKLPPALARFADEAKLNKTLYAEGIVKDIKAGKLPKNYLDPDYPHEFV